MNKLLLVDGHSLIHRAYHAYPKTLATAKGELTNAVYGFTNILLTAISEAQPTHLAVAFDLPKPTFRQAMFVGYKRSRVKPDAELITQIPRIKEVVRTLNIPIYEVEGFEADDVIGTLTKQAISENSEYSVSRSVRRSKNQRIRESNLPVFRQSDSSGPPSFQSFPKTIQVIILTSDRDLMQLVNDDQVVVKMPQRGKKANRSTGYQDNRKPQPSNLSTCQPDSLADIWDESRFIKDWGFEPKLLPDYKALAGDQSDDIPGVKGIGVKTAKELIAAYGEINNIYRELFKGLTWPRQGQALIKKLVDGQDSAQLSQQLATIDTNVPIYLDWEQTQAHEYDKDKVMKLFEELEFRSLSNKLPNDKFEQEVQEALF